MKAKAIIPLDEYVNFEDPVIKIFDYLYNLRHSDGKHYFFTLGPDVALGSGSTAYNIGDLQFNADILVSYPSKTLNKNKKSSSQFHQTFC